MPTTFTLKLREIAREYRVTVRFLKKAPEKYSYYENDKKLLESVTLEDYEAWNSRKDL